MFYTSKDGFKIYYNFLNKQFGKPVLVFLHGWLGNWTTFKKEIDHFKKDYSILYIDFRGHGLSDKPVKIENYNIKRLRTDLEGIFRKENISKSVLIGFSMGGMVSLLFTVKNPELVDKLVLINTTHKNPFYSSKSSYIKNHKNFFKILCDFLVKNTKIKKEHYSHVDFDISKFENKSSLNITFNSLLNIPLHSAVATFEGLFNYKVKGISKITCPSLIISTTKDPLFSEKIEKKLASNIKTSKHIIKEGTHHLIIQKPNEVIKEIEKFIK